MKVAETHTMGAQAVRTWATKTDGVYHLLRRRVLDGSLAPGSVIEQEAMAISLDVSTTPLREAVRRLQAEGLLLQVAHREMKVPDLEAKEIDEIYQVRLQLDPYAITLGARHATDAQRGEVQALHEALTHAVGTVYAWKHHELHQAMYRASGNVVLTQTLDRLWERSVRYRVILFRGLQGSRTGTRNFASLERTVAAYVEGDREEAASSLRTSIENARSMLLDRLAS